MRTNARTYRIHASEGAAREIALGRYFDDLVFVLSDVSRARIGFVAAVEYRLPAPWSLEAIGLRRWPGTRLLERNPGVAVRSAPVTSIDQEKVRFPDLLPDFNDPDLFGFYRRGIRALEVGWYCGHEGFGCFVSCKSTPQITRRVEQVVDHRSDVALDGQLRPGYSRRLWT